MEREDIAEKVPESPEPANRVLKINRNTPAARWNSQMMRGLSLALEEDAEVDLLSVLPDFYSKQLAMLLHKNPGLPKKKPRAHFQGRDTRVMKLLNKVDDLPASIIELLARGEVLFQYARGCSTMVLRVSEAIVVKITRDVDNITEYTSMQYLWDHKPSVPAPRPLGLVKMSSFNIMFMTFMSGRDLDKVWLHLEDNQKREISCQLDMIAPDLRFLPFPKNQPLGGVQGEGCKDARRNIRFSSKPIMTVKDFEDFIFSSHHSENSVYLKFLRSFSRTNQPEPNCVFTHGDLRPANIKVKQNEDGKWKVLGILDWESSGFYPAYWEALKMTNNLSSLGQSDWYLYLPTCISPLQCPTRWLLDRVWDPNVA